MDFFKTSSRDSSIPWEAIKETALQDANLRADIRVSQKGSVTINPAWRAVSAFLGYPPVTRKETIKNLKTIFFNYLGSKYGLEKGRRLPEDVIQSVNKIFQNEKASTSELIQQAHLASMGFVDKIVEKTKQTPGESTPSIQVTIASTEAGRSVVITELAKTTEWSLAGGGMKGTAYIEAYEALEAAGMVKDLEHISGASVGSISAACIACGMSAKEFRAASEAITPQCLQQESKNSFFEDLIEFDETQVGARGTLGLEVINQYLANTIRVYLKKVSFEQLWNPNPTEDPLLAKLDSLESKERTMLSDLKTEFEYHTTNPIITFGHLSILHKLDSEKFKDLSINVFDQTYGKGLCYSSRAASAASEIAFAEDALDTPIVVGIRMSTAFPVAFKPVKIKINGTMHVMADGGIASNIPTPGRKKTIFSEGLNTASSSRDVRSLVQNDEPSAENAKTLHFAFNAGGHLNRVLHQGKLYVSNKPWNRIRSWFAGNSHLSEANMRDNIKLWHGASNVINVYHGDLGTLSFGASKERVAAAQLQAKVRMKEQLALRKDQAIHHTYTFQELEQVITSKEKVSDEALSAIITEAQKIQNELGPILKLLESDEESKLETEKAEKMSLMAQAFLNLATHEKTRRGETSVAAAA